MSSFRILVSAIFALAVLAAPWPIGGNFPFARTWLLGFTLVALLLAIVDIGAKRPLARFPLVWILLALGAGYVLFQASDVSAGLNEKHGGPRPFQQSAVNDTGAISINPAATRAKPVSYTHLTLPTIYPV